MISIGKYELITEFDRFGQCNPDTIKRYRKFVSAMCGNPNTRVKIHIEVKQIGENVNEYWMRKSEKEYMAKGE
jgi:hypothetical protein